jgi:hypothetical protein
MQFSRNERHEFRALKAEQCSPDERSDTRIDRLAGDPQGEGRATEAENLGPVDLIRTLAELAGRTLIFEHRLWSTKNVRRCTHARREPTTWTP